MNKRERVIAAITHNKTKLTPWAFELTGQVSKMLSDKFGADKANELLDSHILFGRYKKVEWISDKVYQDVFGVQWRIGDDGGDTGIPINEQISEGTVGNFIFPELDRPYLDKTLNSLAKDKEHFRMFRCNYTLYERAWSLMGMENLLISMALYEKEMHRLFERITEYQLKLIEYVLPGDFEGVYFGDDWGQQRGLIMGPVMWRKYLKPYLSKMFNAVKSHKKFILLHSCGNIEELFEDLIEMGVDVYNTVQPEIYDLANIKGRYGSRLSFWGAMSTQQFLPQATPEEVYDKSVKTIRILGPNGGYMFSPSHAITPDIPVENILAMKHAVQDTKW